MGVYIKLSLEKNTNCTNCGSSALTILSSYSPMLIEEIFRVWDAYAWYLQEAVLMLRIVLICHIRVRQGPAGWGGGWVVTTPR